MDVVSDWVLKLLSSWQPCNPPEKQTAIDRETPMNERGVFMNCSPAELCRRKIARDVPTEIISRAEGGTRLNGHMSNAQLPFCLDMGKAFVNFH